mmetsp:Transcript_54000/g.107299  ORF Transcript_54000/g.107299 Transcript_54000/m.107299 type:complete len:119 (+) Transcript_54000:83-439(+)
MSRPNAESIGPHGRTAKTKSDEWRAYRPKCQENILQSTSKVTPPSDCIRSNITDGMRQQHTMTSERHDQGSGKHQVAAISISARCSMRDSSIEPLCLNSASWSGTETAARPSPNVIDP